MNRSRKKHSNYSYSKLADREDFTDEQFQLPPTKIPWKAICLATFLCCVGFVLLLIGSLIITGHIDSQYSDRMWSLIVLGVIMFLPGFYHLRIAYYAFRNFPGYSFDDIPEFE
ncbi:transmembrane protein 230 [Arctopsyche grandis]|uniref:transmembrane protein 230 n=1 Tax=Arctopsyche grandis TaxID=121162 RepID=UPI00406D98B4